MKIRALLWICLIGLLAACLPDTSAELPGADLAGYRYDALPDAADTSRAAERLLGVSRWQKLDLTYFFANGTDDLPDDEEHQVVRQAFDTWALRLPLTFTETPDRAQADIVIAWTLESAADPEIFAGVGGVLAHTTFPNPFKPGPILIEFDDHETWVDSAVADVDLLSVALHEIGHVLGLGHSRDPNKVMFARYSGGHRQLNVGDVTAARELYGINNVRPRPQNPIPDAAVPAAAAPDADGDGLADAEERMLTGTDPAVADTDGDGLADGLEVLHLLNPLDPDMDRDAAGDGEEVQAGTNPLFPDRLAVLREHPALATELETFWSRIIRQQALAFRNNDPDLARQILGYDVLAPMEQRIASLGRQGLAQIATYDDYASYIHDVRVLTDKHVKIDACQTWINVVFQVQAWDEEDQRLEDVDVPTAVSGEGRTLTPQTMTLRRLNTGWRITEIEYYNPPAFCR